ncbi:hypothetical protein IQK56_25680 [Pseudomonas sp. MAFF 301449]|uniref:Uncharacterized protein n=1 Tax=Pseudomonas cyclaminis TaxID=2781239 RepID=A0ABR9SYM4_9PSED|nr:hypothetical protein [Pseudomonas cyclaminis]MBE8594032.1 hypothetical protein [Pseudomonas cyclaminis]MBE8603486.1 hypothetical protein [Pseudomonas cyclaminis]
MSEAQRWTVKNTLPNSDGGTPFIRPEVVLAADFDRVTADRDALQRDLEQQKRYVEINANSAHGKHMEGLRYRDERDALQQRLTAADERVDVLEAGVKWESDRNALLLASLTEAEDMLSVTSLEAGQRIEVLEGVVGEVLDAVGREPLDLEAVLRLRARMRSALKPTEGAGDDA